MHFSVPFPFPTYFALEIKRKFGIARAEKGVEDNFLNEYPILIK